MFWYGLIVGMFIGTFLGMLIMGLCAMAAEGNRMMPRKEGER